MITENLSTLKIHKLTQEQYNRALAAGNIDNNAIYLTPDDITSIEGGGTGADNAKDARANLGAIGVSTKTITLTSSEWFVNNGTICWIDPGISTSFSNGTIFVSPDPKNLSSYNEYIRCGVRCISCGNGAIVFAADIQPSIDVIANVSSFQ